MISHRDRHDHHDHHDDHHRRESWEGPPGPSIPRWSAGFSRWARPIGFTAPRSGLDPSWRLGLSWAAAHSIPAAGKGIVFTYGPMGFLAVPNIAWRPGLILGIVYVLGAAFAFFSLAYAAIIRWTGVVWGLIATAVLAVGVAYLGTAPELAALRSSCGPGGCSSLPDCTNDSRPGSRVRSARSRHCSFS